MKKLLAVLAFIASNCFAQSTYRMEYETQIAPTDLAGSVFNAELLSTLKGGKHVNIGSGFPVPRLRVAVQTIPIAELTDRLSVFFVTMLLDQETGDSLYLGSWPGYVGDLAAKQYAKNVGNQINKFLEEFDAEVNKPSAVKK